MVAISRASARESPADISRAPTAMRLLDRQARLLAYLTSSGAIFGEDVHDIRPIFEDDLEKAAPTRRDTPLAVAIPPGAEHPRIFEMPPPVFDALGALDDWTDRSELGAASQVDKLICDLAAHGLIEVRP